MVSPWSIKDPRENTIEKFITHRSWKKYVAYLEVPLREVKTGCRQEREQQDQGHMPSLGNVVECFGVLGLKLGWSTQT